MRLFVAALSGPDPLEHLDRALAAVLDMPGAPRWTAPELRHLTLAFLGEVAEPQLAALMPGLAIVAAAHGHLALRLSGVGTFPTRGAPRVFWAGLAGAGSAAPDPDSDPDPDGDPDRDRDRDRGGSPDPVAELVELARSVARAARGVGIAIERRPYRPHLTLGRWRPGDKTDLSVVTALTEYESPPFEVSEIVLMRSHLGPRPRYDQLASWPLTALAPR